MSGRTRRGFLAAVGAVAVAGCGSTPESSPTGTPTATDSPTATPTDTPAPALGPIEGAWPMVGFDPAGTGYDVDGAAPAEPPETAWVADATVGGNETVADRLVVGDGTVAAVDRGGVVAYDAATGDVRWRRPYPSARALVDPVVRDGTLALGVDATVRGLSLADGSEAWRASVPGSLGRLAGEPDGFVAVTDAAGEGASGRVLALSPDGEERWAVGPGDLSPDGVELRGAAVLADGTVYVAGRRSRGDGVVLALDAADGDQRWHASLPVETSALTATPVAAYVGGLSDGLVRALDQYDGSHRWDAHLDGSMVTALATDGDAVYAGGPAPVAGGSDLVALAPGGTERWSARAGGERFVGAGDALLAGWSGAPERPLRAVGRADGAERWRLDLPYGVHDVVVVDGVVFLADGLTDTVRALA